jgi:hypothetical protein
MRREIGYAFLKNVLSDWYLVMNSSDKEESNQVSNTRVSPFHSILRNCLSVIFPINLLSLNTSASLGAGCALVMLPYVKLAQNFFSSL